MHSKTLAEGHRALPLYHKGKLQQPFQVRACSQDRAKTAHLSVSCCTTCLQASIRPACSRSRALLQCSVCFWLADRRASSVGSNCSFAPASCRLRQNFVRVDDVREIHG